MPQNDFEIHQKLLIYSLHTYLVTVPTTLSERLEILMKFKLNKLYYVRFGNYQLHYIIFNKLIYVYNKIESM